MQPSVSDRLCESSLTNSDSDRTCKFINHGKEILFLLWMGGQRSGMAAAPQPGSWQGVKTLHNGIAAGWQVAVYPTLLPVRRYFNYQDI